VKISALANAVTVLEQRAAELPCPACGRVRTGTIAGTFYDLHEFTEEEAAELYRVGTLTARPCPVCKHPKFDMSAATDDELHNLSEIIRRARSRAYRFPTASGSPRASAPSKSSGAGSPKTCGDRTPRSRSG
jgi:hypothetical protein